MLIADVCKPLTEFQKKLLYLFNQSTLKLQFKKWLSHSEKSHAIGILENLVGVCCLSPRECNGKIV